MPAQETAKLKVQLKLAITRLRSLQQKKVAIAKQSRRELANVMAAGKEASARIRVENVIREDVNIELLEILEREFSLVRSRLAGDVHRLLRDVIPPAAGDRERGVSY